MTRREVPGSVRIRTDEGNEWRYDAIQAAADYYDCNRSDAVAYACEDITGAIEFIEAVLEIDDLTLQQRRTIAELANNRLRATNVEVLDEVRVELG